MTQLIPFASGKGGVGKTLIISNLGIELSKNGKTVILVDMDLGSANLHTFLGIKNNQEGLGSYLHQKERSLESYVCPTDYKQLYIIPGDELMAGTANLPFYQKKKLLLQLSELTADYVLMDLGAGTNFNVLDYTLINPEPFVIINPNPPSILNAYSLIKCALYRRLIKLLPAKDERREILTEALSGKIEGTDNNLNQILEELFSSDPQTLDLLYKCRDRFKPQIIINMGRSQNDVKMALPLRKMCHRYFDLHILFRGFLHYQEDIYKSVRLRRPYILDYRNTPFSEDLERLAQSIITRPILSEENDLNLIL